MFRLTLLTYLTTFCIVYLISTTEAVGKRKWDNIDWDKVEKDLEKDDDPELLTSEDTLNALEYEKRKKMPIQPPDNAALKDPTEWIKHQQAMSGPAMLFCTLKVPCPRKDCKDGLWSNETIKAVAYEWKELLKTASLEAQVYDISDAGAKDGGINPPRVLVTTNLGWRGYEFRDFLLTQPEMAELEWDQVKYTPDDLATLEKNKGKRTGGNDPMELLTKHLEKEANPGAKKNKNKKSKTKATPQSEL